jgi:hypothetical protein
MYIYIYLSITMKDLSSLTVEDKKNGRLKTRLQIIERINTNITQLVQVMITQPQKWIHTL